MRAGSLARAILALACAQEIVPVPVQATAVVAGRTASV